MLLDESRQVKRKNGFTFLVKPFSEFYHQRGSPTFPTNNGNETLKFDCVGAAKTSSVVFPRSSKSAIGAFGICVEAFSVQSKSSNTTHRRRNSLPDRKIFMCLSGWSTSVWNNLAFRKIRFAITRKRD